MKHRKYVRASCALSVCLCASSAAFADTEVPCLVLSGQAQSERHIDLSKLNRITFGPESMTVSSADGKDAQELLYSLYHHIEIKSAVPDIETGIVLNPTSENASMRYLADTRSLKIEAAQDSRFKTGVFDIKGTLVMTAEIAGGESLSVESLAAGTYVAVATDGTVTLSIKFLIN